MLIRALEDPDIPAVAALFQSAAREFIVHESAPDGAERFLGENDEAGFRAHVARGYAYQVATIGEHLAGFAAVRDGSHLYHLFVDKRWHRQGIATQLWHAVRDAALAAGNPGCFTVNASRLAVPVYAAWGFVPTAPLQFVNGLYFVPMRLELAKA
jgi:GNAT superfamily N-acetyltransferase